MAETLYYAYIDGEQRGPFTADQLVEVGIRPSTYIWSKEMDDWHRADEVAAVRELFKRHLHRTRTATDVEPERVVPEEVRPKDARPEPPAPDQIRFPIPESVMPEEDINREPQVSMTLAVLSLILCFPPGGIVAVIFASKAQKAWRRSLAETDAVSIEKLRRQSHEYERLAKMWLGLTVAFGVIGWTLLFSIR